MFGPQSPGSPSDPAATARSSTDEEPRRPNTGSARSTPAPPSILVSEPSIRKGFVARKVDDISETLNATAQGVTQHAIHGAAWTSPASSHLSHKVQTYVKKHVPHEGHFGGHKDDSRVGTPDVAETSTAAQGEYSTIVLWHISCQGLQAADVLTGSADPYCSVLVGGLQQSTNVFKRTLDPCWPAVLTCLVPPGCAELLVLIRDWNVLMPHRHLGQFVFRIPSGVWEGEVKNVALEATEKRLRVQGTLSFSWQIIGDAHLTKSPALLHAQQERMWQAEEQRQRKEAKWDPICSAAPVPKQMAFAAVGVYNVPQAEPFIAGDGSGSPGGSITISTIFCSGLQAVSYHLPGTARTGTVGAKAADPYCAIRVHSSFGTDEVYLPVRTNELNPQWNEPVTLNVWEQHSRLELVFWGWSSVKDHKLGSFCMPLGAESKKGELHSQIRPGKSSWGTAGSVYLQYEYKAPPTPLASQITARIASGSTASFGKVIFRDICVSDLAVSTTACPVVELILTSEMGYQSKETNVAIHDNRVHWDEFVVFSIYARDMELAIFVRDAQLFWPLPDSHLGTCRLLMPDHTSHFRIRAKLLSEKHSKSHPVGTVEFTMSVVYVERYELWSCLQPHFEDSYVSALRGRKARPKTNIRVMRESSFMLFHFIASPCRLLYHRTGRILSWRNPWLSLPCFGGCLMVTHHGWYLQLLLCAMLCIYPLTYLNRDWLILEAGRIRQVVDNSAQRGKELRQEEKQKQAQQRRERRQKHRVGLKNMVAGIEERWNTRNHNQELLLLRIAQDARAKLSECMDASDEDTEDEDGETMASRLRIATWEMYRATQVIEQFVSFFTWQNPRNTRLLCIWTFWITLSTFLVPTHWLMSTVVVYLFTIQGLYIRYPVLWRRFPPWKLHYRLLQHVRGPRFFAAEVHLKILHASGLQPTDVHTGRADPYVVVRQPATGFRYKTHVKHATLHPVWNEHVPKIYVRSANARILLEVWDENVIPIVETHSLHFSGHKNTSDFAGYSELTISRAEQQLGIMLPLQPHPGSKNYCTGHLAVELTVRVLSKAEADALPPTAMSVEWTEVHAERGGPCEEAAGGTLRAGEHVVMSNDSPRGRFYEAMRGRSTRERDHSASDKGSAGPLGPSRPHVAPRHKAQQEHLSPNAPATSVSDPDPHTTSASGANPTASPGSSPGSRRHSAPRRFLHHLTHPLNPSPGSGRGSPSLHPPNSSRGSTPDSRRGSSPGPRRSFTPRRFLHHVSHY